MVAVPAAVLAIVFVDLGGIGWTVLMAILACACLNELYPMLSDWRPVPVVGFAVAIGMCLAAHYGNESDMVGVALAAAPLTFLAILARAQTARVDADDRLDAARGVLDRLCVRARGAAAETSRTATGS